MGRFSAFTLDLTVWPLIRFFGEERQLNGITGCRSGVDSHLDFRKEWFEQKIEI